MRGLIKKILREELDNLSQDNPIISAIKQVVGNEYEGVIYQQWEEVYQDYIIKFHITKVSIWSTEGYENNSSFLRSIYHPKPNSTYEGTVHVKIDKLLVGSKQNDEWEKMYGEDDITETAWDDFTDYIHDTISTWLPSVEVDVEFTF